MRCRHCNHPLIHKMVDLGYAPPSNALRKKEDLERPELSYPLRVYVCDSCWLVQTEDYVGSETLFPPDYVYFSSISATWLNHAERYTEKIIDLLGLNHENFVIEIASNDGYLLKNFVKKDIPCLGIEPAEQVAEVAERQGIRVLKRFFNSELAEELAQKGQKADLIIGNNVYAHVPDINDFTLGLKRALKPEGTLTLEFPHLLKLIQFVQFDTIYHEHYSYLSLHTVQRIFEKAGLKIWDVEELPTHGGSLRVYGCHREDMREENDAVTYLLEEEKKEGLQNLETYLEFQDKVNRIKNMFLMFLITSNEQGKKLAGYGAAAKAATLINYAGVKPDLIPYICDAAPSKQGKYLPGSHIPIMHPSVFKEKKPDTVIIFPWNIAQEIAEQHKYITEWGGGFVTMVPEITTIEAN